MFLSTLEEKFARECAKLEMQVYGAVLLDRLPENMRDSAMDPPKPPTHVFVYIKVNSNIGEIEHEGDVIEFTRGQTMIVRYDAIKMYLDDKSIELL